jgi:hypothetical protein
MPAAIGIQTATMAISGIASDILAFSLKHETQMQVI